VDVEAAAAFAGFDAVALAVTESAVLARLPSSRRPAARVTAWVRKEAVLKATRDGLRVPPRDVVVSPLGQPPRLLAWGDAPPTPVHLHDVDVAAPGHAACVGVVAAARPVFRVSCGEALLDGIDG
jgi:4'-phosphopantetheinyl transferase